MEKKTIRKLSLWNLKIVFPTILSIALGAYLYRDIKIAQAISIAFFLIGIIGLTLTICQLLTKIIVANDGISQVFLMNERKIKFEQIKTLELYKINRFGNRKLNKIDIYSLNVKVNSQIIILISKIEGKRPTPWWKKDKDTISIPFQHNILKAIETNMKG